MNRECSSCIKFKTFYCPCSIDCMATDDKPFYQDKMMLLKENEKLKEEIENLKEKHFLIQGGRSTGKTYLIKLQQ